MSRRVPVDRALGPMAPRPTAGPANVFVETSAGAEMQQIAQAFGRMSPTLGRLTTGAVERKKVKDEAAGAEAARTLERLKLDYAEGIKRGVIDPIDSPFFRYGLKRQMGTSAALRYERELRDAVTNQLPDTAGLAEFEQFHEQWFDQWSQQNVGGNRDEAFVAGFADAAQAARQNIALNVAARQNQALVVEFEYGLSSSIGGMLSGLQPGASPADYNAAAENINRTLAEAARLNPNLRSRITDITLEAVSAAAFERGDIEMFDRVAERLRGGTGNFAQIAKVKEERERLYDAILDRQDRETRRAEAERQTTERNELRSAIQGFTEAAEQAGGRWDLVDPEPFVRALNDKDMAHLGLELREWSNRMRDARYRQVEATSFNRLVIKGVEGTLTVRDITRAGILSPSQALTLNSLLNQGGGGGSSAARRAMSSPYYESAVNAIRGAFASFGGPDGNPESALAEQRTFAAFYTSFLNWMKPYEERGEQPQESDIKSFVDEHLRKSIQDNGGSFRSQLMAIYESISGQSPTAITSQGQPVIPQEDLQSLVGVYARNGVFSQPQIALIRRAFPDMRDVYAEWDEVGKKLDEQLRLYTATPRSARRPNNNDN